MNEFCSILICKIFVVFREVLAPLIPYYVTYDLNYGLTRSRLLRLAFLFFNLLQNINSLKDILQILWTLLGLLFKRLALSAWYQEKGPVNLYISCPTTVQKFLTVPEISVQVSFRGRTLRFWSLKSLITYRVTLSTVRLAKDCWDEHFLFYNLILNINSLKDILLILGPF